jgi:hypothetical protein
MIVDAEDEFLRALEDPLNLIAVHRAMNRGPGRRVREMSLNRAVVVLTVAAWQAYLQDLVNEILDKIAIPAGQTGYEHFGSSRVTRFKLRTSSVRRTPRTLATS